VTNFTITELAKEFELTTRAIRFYEDQHLLAPVRDGQRRIYSKGDRVRLKIILRSRRLGFSLGEIKAFFDLYDSVKVGKISHAQFCKVLASKHAQLNQLRKDIDAMLSDIAMLEVQFGQFAEVKGKRYE